MAIQAKLEKAKKFAEMTMNGNSNISLTDGKLDLNNFKTYMEDQDIPIDIMIRAIEEVSRKNGKRPLINYEEIADDALAKYTGSATIKSNKLGKDLLLKKLSQLGYPVERVYKTDNTWELKIGNVNIIGLSLKGINVTKGKFTSTGKPVVHYGYGAGADDTLSVNISIVHFNQNDVNKTRFFILESRQAMKEAKFYKKVHPEREKFASEFANSAEDENNWSVINKMLPKIK